MRCVFTVIVPLTIVTVTLLSSAVMLGLSHDKAVESHRLQRETTWDIPVMDTLRLWKRNMGTVGSGKVKLIHHYTDGEIQHYNITQTYHSKMMENTVSRLYPSMRNQFNISCIV